ncbi:efflux RND transporter periplasmic adaptor subunit [Acidimangrovimonas sediminis]|uniref:efflux RND transporter periplasmic adaptor subunit n=1 Tax=Acidimangrovimonas sediminis TaxID=2056283 RepID=UPI000C802F56|nr:HlyD family efflux transporter periplasmic adaptor subunit [Acidimangrovimonas sediminis]
MKSRRLLSVLAALALLAAALGWAFWPTPVQVDLAAVTRGPMEVTVAAEGTTQIRQHYDVSAPVAGTLARAPVDVGDRVTKDETLVAVIHPSEPAFLDARARAQALAAVDEARAGLALARARLAEAGTNRAHAETEFARAQALAARGTIPRQMLEDAEAALMSARAAGDAASSAVDQQQASLSRAEALLLSPGGTGAASGCCVEIRAPASGTVLTLANSSARPVQPGETLMTIGDPADLEIEVDLLSSDAVQVAVGALAHVTRWGGTDALTARVRRIDPTAFTKVSALGIEEQRVHLRLDLVTPRKDRAGLGDAYRVYVRVVLWAGTNVLQVPIGALFRSGEGWAVFRAQRGRAVLTPVTLGHQTETAAQVLAGLAEGDSVVAFPGAALSDGSRIVRRTTE